MKNIPGLTYDQFLSEIIRKDCYNLNISKEFISSSKIPGSTEYEWAHSLNKKRDQPFFIQTKVSTQSIDYIQFLEGLGFYLIDTNVILKRKIENNFFYSPDPITNEITFRAAIDSDSTGAENIAKSSFVFSRFHLDPWFSIDEANNIKGQWVANYFHGKRGDQMIISEVNDRTGGFLQILKPKDDHFIIDLIGVDKAYQRKGLAQQMINFSMKENKNARYVIVGTQIGNIPSIRLYQKLGFYFETASYVFHFHNE